MMKFDEIGYWSELKLDIIKQYCSAYSTILSAQKSPELIHVYIDAFAGAGRHVSKKTGEFVPGSPINALSVRPPFREYFLIDLDSERTEYLKQLVGPRKDVHILNGDCNTLLVEEVFPKVQYKDYRRGLCILDPYGLHLDWKVINMAGQMGSVELFLNFPVADMNRNVLWRNPEGIAPHDIARMNAFWGNESWRDIAYSTLGNLFSFPEKEDNETIAEGFRKRLKKSAGFKHVPKPLPMHNSKGAIIYYLFFAAQKPVAKDIVEDIFNKYRTRGG